ncbi:DUF817 domain-containing protein [Maricaulis sp.]|uniref:DUF817 domain-containing protein n=1 Tax=Maricaulis sp. TaxID=1486257 RepID=UPI003A93AB17
MHRHGPRAFLHARHAALRAWFVRGPWSRGVFEFVIFGFKQAWACLFGGLMLAMLVASFLWYPTDAALARYDAITIFAILIQLTLLVTRLETLEEAKVIAIFHVVGTVMEIFKTAAGSWVYPEESVLCIAGVPLFSGFMYAAVGSYLARVWRIFEFRFDRFPNLWLQFALATAVYINFFTHHYGPDMRLLLFVAAVAIYGRCVVWFRPDEAHRPMPLVIGFLLVALFIWFAENLGTFARAWSYPGQEEDWHMVSWAKLGSWYLLMIISFVLVAAVQYRRNDPPRDDR